MLTIPTMAIEADLQILLPLRKHPLKGYLNVLKKTFLAGRVVGRGHSPYAAAEFLGDYKGGFNSTFAIIKAANIASADAIKMLHGKSNMITINHWNMVSDT
tara:strand:+ start:209 stop:511 length:303 start_codon:yes stop_codon:yes gene_type:complete